MVAVVKRLVGLRQRLAPTPVFEPTSTTPAALSSQFVK
jgi:hypothetical protein